MLGAQVFYHLQQAIKLQSMVSKEENQESPSPLKNKAWGNGEEKGFLDEFRPLNCLSLNFSQFLTVEPTSAFHFQCKKIVSGPKAFSD